MFSNDTKESRENEVVFADIDEGLLAQLVGFLVNDKIGDIAYSYQLKLLAQRPSNKL